MALASPFFSSLPLQQYGLEFIHPPFAAAHPFDDGRAAVLETSIEQTADRLGADRDRYRSLMGPLVGTGHFLPMQYLIREACPPIPLPWLDLSYTPYPRPSI